MRRSKTLSAKVIWVSCLIAALLLMQGARLHIHTTSHDHEPTQISHGHHDEFHFAHEAVGDGHPDEAGQVDLAQEGVLKKLLGGWLLVAAVFAIIGLLPACSGSHKPWRTERGILPRLRPSGFSPPLRAPPL